jgi:hypothetical protein
MVSDTFFRDLFSSLDSVPHISLALQPVPPAFDLSVEYLQSLMMVVAIVLALGFSILVALAVLLCLIISFAPPLLWPSWPYRLVVVAGAVGLVVVAAHSVDGAENMQLGMTNLLGALDELRRTLTDVADLAGNLSAPTAAYNESVAFAAACLGCGDNKTYWPPEWVNTTRALCGAASPLPYGLLGVTSGSAHQAVQQFLNMADAGPTEVRAAHARELATHSACRPLSRRAAAPRPSAAVAPRPSLPPADRRACAARRCRRRRSVPRTSSWRALAGTRGRRRCRSMR